MKSKMTTAAESKSANTQADATRGTEPLTSKTTKSSVVIALLSRPEGATVDAMMKATGWQAHSVRGFLAGTLKKKLGKAVMSEKTDAGRVYRIFEAQGA
jgi:hypothetical protein